MRKLKVLAAPFLAVIFLFGVIRPVLATPGVWSNISSTIYYNEGNVAIGASTADAPLHLSGTDTNVDKLLMKIGNIPERSWSIYGGQYSHASRGNYALIISQDNYGAGCPGCVGDIQFKPGKNFIISQGYVGIGTSLPTQKLSVNGTVLAKEVIVSTASSYWPDYVFEEGYNLMSLEELEAYIKENHHLPNIPSENEVEENGISLGEMQRLHMEKIEELTLYLLELKKENDVLKNQNSELESRLEVIESKLAL